MKFTSFAAPGYPLLEKQFEKMKFEPWNNHWSEIHNFTKKAGERNHSLFATIDSFELFDWKRAFFEAEL